MFPHFYQNIVVYINNHYVFITFIFYFYQNIFQKKKNVD